MKVRVVEKKNGKFYSEYYLETSRGSYWTGTKRNLNSITQNEFNTLERAIEECNWYAKEHGDGKVVWQAEL